MFGRLRVGIMGTGKIAGIMAETLRAARGVELYAVGSRAMENASKFAQTFSVKKVYGSYEELVADPKADLIYIATPHSEHYENAKLALTAGKNVLCEKAFMLNEAQAREVFALAEEKKLFITEAIWTRYMPMRTKIMEVLASNVIGEPTMLTANLGYNIVYKNRINDPRLGGGALLDLGVYVLNFASMVFGDDVSDIASICTFNDQGVDMQDSITLRYTNGKMAVLNATVLSNSDRMGIIYGTKGYMVIDNINNPEGITVYDASYKKVAYYKRPRQKTGYEYEVEACAKAIAEGWLECPEMPHAESLKMLNMMDFIRKSNNIVYPADLKETAEVKTQVQKEVQTEVQAESEAPGSENASSSEPVIQNGIEKLQTALGLLTENPTSEVMVTASEQDNSTSGETEEGQ